VYATVEAGGLPGAALLGAYSLGLSLPFLVALVIAPRVIAPVQRVAAHARRWRAAGGVVLIVTGLLLLTGQFARLVRLLPVSR
jgi:cytochrome c-type biogenesis protein